MVKGNALVDFMCIHSTLLFRKDTEFAEKMIVSKIEVIG